MHSCTQMFVHYSLRDGPSPPPPSVEVPSLDLVTSRKRQDSTSSESSCSEEELSVRKPLLEKQVLPGNQHPPD